MPSDEELHILHRQNREDSSAYGSQDFFSGVKPFPMFMENLLNFEGARGLKSENPFRLSAVYLGFQKKVRYYQESLPLPSVEYVK